MVLFPVQMFFIRRLQKTVSALSRDRVRMVRGLSDRIQESVGGLQEIYANDTRPTSRAGTGTCSSESSTIRLNIYNLKYLIKWINNFLEKFGQFLLLLVGGWLIIHRPDTFNLGTLVAFLQAYGQLNEPWRELINFFQLKENARVKYEQRHRELRPGRASGPSSRGTTPRRERPAALSGAYELRQASVVLDGRTPGAGPRASRPLGARARRAGGHGRQRQEHAGPGPRQAERPTPGRCCWTGPTSPSCRPSVAGRAIGFVPSRRPPLHGHGARQSPLRAPAPPGVRARSARTRARPERRGLARPRAARGIATGRRSSPRRSKPCGWWGWRATSSPSGSASARSGAAPGDRRADAGDPPPSHRALRRGAAGDGRRVLRPGPLLVLRVDRREHPLRPQLPLVARPRPARPAPALPRGDRGGRAGRAARRARRRRRPRHGRDLQGHRGGQRALRPVQPAHGERAARVRAGRGARGAGGCQQCHAGGSRPADPARAAADSRPAPPRPDRRRVHRQGAGGAPPVRRDAARAPQGVVRGVRPRALLRRRVAARQPALRQGGRHEQPGREEGERDRGGGAGAGRACGGSCWRSASSTTWGSSGAA